MRKISIIVPIFNVERFIEQCIRSLYSQDLPIEEYEVICVDDCSPDGSRAIVESLQREFPNLQLIIHERNKKLGGARNTGLKVSRGQYIWFVDSDDYIAPNCLATLVNEAIAKDIDVLHFDYMRLKPNANLISCTEPYDDDRILNGEQFVLDESHERWSSKCPVAWRKIYRREFLFENQLFFVEDKMYEDTDWSLLLFAKARKVKHLNISPYFYRMNSLSVTNAKINPKLMMNMICQLSRCTEAYYYSTNESYKMLIYEYIHRQLGVFRKNISEFSVQERWEYNKLIREESINVLKEFCNWKTFLVIKYGITWFIYK